MKKFLYNLTTAFLLFTIIFTMIPLEAFASEDTDSFANFSEDTTEITVLSETAESENQEILPEVSPIIAEEKITTIALDLEKIELPGIIHAAVTISGGTDQIQQIILTFCCDESNIIICCVPDGSQYKGSVAPDQSLPAGEYILSTCELDYGNNVTDIWLGAGNTQYYDADEMPGYLLPEEYSKLKIIVLPMKEETEQTITIPESAESFSQTPTEAVSEENNDTQNRIEIQNLAFHANGIEIIWNSVSDTEEYRLYRCTTGESQRLIATIKAEAGIESYSWLDQSELQPKTTYTYTLAAMKSDASDEESSESVSIRYVPAPVIQNVCSVANGIQISWEKMSSAKKYALYRRTEDEAWQCIASNLTKTEYTDKKAVSGIVYYYSVSDYMGEWSSYDDTGTAGRYIAVPNVTSAENTDEGIVIRFTFTGATAYQIMRSEANGNWTEVTQVDAVDENECSYCDQKTEPGQKYKYSVRAIDEVFHFTSGFNTKGKAVVRLLSPIMTSIDGSGSNIVLHWEKTQGAKKYKIYRRINEEGTQWKSIAETSRLFYKDSKAQSGIEYCYIVRAICDNNYSPERTDELSMLWLGKTVIASVCNAVDESGNAEISVSLKSTVKGADQYVIVRTDSEGTKKTFTMSADTLTYHDMAVEYGKTYKYIAYAHCLKYDLSGKYEEAGKAVLCLQQPELSGIVTNECGITISWVPVDSSNEITGYSIYRRKANTGSWKKIASVKAGSNIYSDRNATTGQLFEYTVQAVRGKQAGSYATTGLTAIKLPVISLSQAINTVENGISGVLVSWKAVNGITGYNVLRKEAGTGEVFQTVARAVRGNSWTDNTVETGHSYIYTVQANNGQDCLGPYNSKGIKCVFVMAPVRCNGSANSRSITLTWDSVQASTGYDVYRRNTGSNKWTLLQKNVAENTYTDSSVKKGFYYDYRIQAKVGNAVSGSVVLSNLCNVYRCETAESTTETTICETWNYQKTGDVESIQDAAVWDGSCWFGTSNGYLLRYGWDPSTGCLSANCEKVALDGTDTICPHCNTMSFCTVNGETYLYTNIYNNYAKNEYKHIAECLVYRMGKSEQGTYYTELVQRLCINFAYDAGLWADTADIRPYGNFIVDGEDSCLYVWVSDSIRNQTLWYKFALPAQNKGSRVQDAYYDYILARENVEDQWATPYSNYPQGAAVIDGKIWTVEGLNQTDYIKKLRVIDPENHSEIMTLNLSEAGLTSEAESVFISEGNVYYCCRSGLYRLNFYSQEHQPIQTIGDDGVARMVCKVCEKELYVLED